MVNSDPTDAGCFEICFELKRLIKITCFMEHLFSTRLTLHHESAVYRVDFDHEKYIFTPEVEGPAFPSFSFIREHDEWHEQAPVPHEMKKHALDALERYLLKQH
jgi:hypothetical protein